jgi:hypothetical protein
LLAEYLVLQRPSHVIIVAIVPFTVEALAETIVVPGTAATTLVHNDSVKIKNFTVTILFLGVNG